MFSATSIMRDSALVRPKKYQRRRHGRQAVHVLILLLCLLVTEVACFVHLQHGPPRSVSPTSLHGVRLNIRQRLRRFRNRPSPVPAAGVSTVSPFSSSATTTTTVPDAASPLLVRGSSLAGLEEEPKSSLYSLPEVQNRKLTRLEKEFREMLVHFTQYSNHDLLSLRDPRMRTLFRGVAASAQEPAVYRAFEVLFEDLYPLRIAGRLIYSNLKKLMVASQQEREEEVEQVVVASGLSPMEVEISRLSFVTTAAELNGDSYLLVEQLAETGLSRIANEVLGFESVYDLLQNIDKDNKGKLSFTDLMIGLRRCAEEMCLVEACNPATVMYEISKELEDHPLRSDLSLDPKRQRHSDRYDHMVHQFRQWADLIPTDEGRRLDVVRGCFVGAENEDIVEALRIVYCDYLPLRTAGDLIFKLVRSVLEGKRRRLERPADTTD